MGAIDIRRRRGEFPKKLAAYLGLYQEYWNALLKPEDHKHEIGEDTIGCYNCRMDRAAARMSEYEMACFEWYCGNVNQFVFDGGILPDLIREIRFQSEKIRRLFLRAMNIMYQAFEFVSADRAKRELEAMRNRD